MYGGWNITMIILLSQFLKKQNYAINPIKFKTRLLDIIISKSLKH